MTRLSHRIRFLVPLLVVCAASARSQSAAVDTLPPAARAALEATDISWKSRRTPHAVVYALAGSAAEKRLAADAQRAERAIVANLGFLGIRSPGPRLRIFLVGSREQMRRFAGGHAYGGLSVTAEGTAFLVANDSVRPALKHETMHLLSWRHWGPPAAPWLSEGLATLAVGPCQGHSVAQLVVAAKMAGLFAPLDTLRSAFVNEREIGVVHYVEAASLVQHVDRKYGRKKLRALWSSGRPEGALGVEAPALEKGWKESLSRIAPKSSWARIWKGIDARGCE